jgi:hypothetical protein
MKFHFSVFHHLSFGALKRQCIFFSLFSMFLDTRKSIAFFGGCRYSPACPSAKNNIRIKWAVVQWYWEAKNELMWDNLSYCQFVHQNWLLDWLGIETETLRWDVSSWRLNHGASFEQLRSYKKYLYIHLLYRREITGSPQHKPIIKFWLWR